MAESDTLGNILSEEEYSNDPFLEENTVVVPEKYVEDGYIEDEDGNRYSLADDGQIETARDVHGILTPEGVKPNEVYLEPVDDSEDKGNDVVEAGLQGKGFYNLN